MKKKTPLTAVPETETVSRLFLDFGLKRVKKYDRQSHFWEVRSKDLDDWVQSCGARGMRFVDLELIPLGTRTPLGIITSCRWDAEAKRFIVSYREWNARSAKEYSVTELRRHLKEHVIASVRLGDLERNVADAAAEVYAVLYICVTDIFSILTRPIREWREDAEDEDGVEDDE